MMIEKRNMLKVKEKQKEDWKKQRWFCLALIFSWEKWREKKDEQGISKNSSKLKRFISHTLFLKREENRKRNKHGRKRKSRRCLLQFVGWKTTFFQRHHNKQAKMRKLEKTFFKTQKHNTKQENICKTCPTHKGNRQNRVFGDITEKESWTEVYKDSKNCEERLQTEKTKRQPKSKKNQKNEMAKKAKNTERQKKRTSG